MRFLEDPQQFRGPSTLARIDRQISSATALASRIAALDHEVSPAPCCWEHGTLLLSNRPTSSHCPCPDRLAHAGVAMQVACDRPYVSKVHMKDRGSMLWRDDPAGDFGVSEPQPPSLSFSTPPMFAA